VLYGSESWTVTKPDEEKLRISERFMAIHVKMVSGELNTMICIKV
jgi:hypothetical protein